MTDITEHTFRVWKRPNADADGAELTKLMEAIASALNGFGYLVDVSHADDLFGDQRTRPECGICDDTGEVACLACRHTPEPDPTCYDCEGAGVVPCTDCPEER